MKRTSSSSSVAPTVSNWQTVTESAFAWERDALEFIRTRFPAHEPYRAWSNFEFIADDGSVNEVDLLVFSPAGLFLVEIKSRPGRLTGDAGTWTWDTEGRLYTDDNPLFSTNTKAKKLRALLQRQRATRASKTEIPYIEPLIFCSAPNLAFELRDNAAARVCLRDHDKLSHHTEQANAETVTQITDHAGIMAALINRQCPGLEKFPKGTHDRPASKLVAQALEQAGIRASQRSRTVSDYRLGRIIGEGPGYQDWSASLVSIPSSKRRVRLYHVRGEAAAQREALERAALREFQILESLQNPGILRIHGCSQHELGPALIFEHDPHEIRLDHFLAQRQGSLGIDTRLDLMRQIAEAVQFAHVHKMVHRGLSPQSILVTNAAGPRPRIKIFNWQAGFRNSTSATAGNSRSIAATAHVDRLVDGASLAYMAPEAMGDPEYLGEALDVFSLGALAYLLFSGVPPAASGAELSTRLRETRGLQISAVLNGAGVHLQDLVKFATHPEVSSRSSSVAEFLEALELVEDELTTPESHALADPAQAQKGDELPGGYTVLKRLGQGACSIAFLVEKGGQEYVLKIANSVDYNERLREESAVIKPLRHPYIVDVVDQVEVGDRIGFLMRPVYSNKESRKIETLGQRIRQDGRLHLELLQRFGEDLLNVLVHLQEQGIPHRDIKPDNMAVGAVGAGDVLHAVLFDFSLARTPVNQIRAGTPGYLDPTLTDRKPPRWDLHAERYAAAVTLYELATGSLPKWGDGLSAPEVLDCEITLETDQFEPSLRDSLAVFFRTAFYRDIARRYENAEQMRDAWRLAFESLDAPGAESDHTDEQALAQRLATATLETGIHDLGLGTRATNALDRNNVLTVEDLLTYSSLRIDRMRGVGAKTRREIKTALRLLRQQLDASGHESAASSVLTGDTAADPGPIDPATLSVDLAVRRLLPRTKKDGSVKSALYMQTLLGLDGTHGTGSLGLWPTQAEVAKAHAITAGRVGQVVGQFQDRWARDSAITAARELVSTLLESAGGVMTLPELAEAVLVARGCTADEPERSTLARALVRAVIETERAMQKPRFQFKRDADRLLVAARPELASYALQLGNLANELAKEDPLVPPQRVLQRLRDVPLPGGGEHPTLTDARLVRLAAAASGHAALSSRSELYPRGMDPVRALRLSQGALYGVKELTLANLRDRVVSRYPEAAPLPDRPGLDGLLQQAGIDLHWDGTSAYKPKRAETFTLTTGSKLPTRVPTQTDSPLSYTPEVALAREFEDKLKHGLKNGSFYALLVPPRMYQRALEELLERFPLELVDFEGLFLTTLLQEATAARVNWDMVLQADADPKGTNWPRLQRLVDRALARLHQQLSTAAKPLLMVYPGVLARYDRLNFLDRLRENVGRRDGVPSLWLLVPGDDQALIEGKTIPLIGPGQKARIPESWLENKHRGGRG